MTLRSRALFSAGILLIGTWGPAIRILSSGINTRMHFYLFSWLFSDELEIKSQYLKSSFGGPKYSWAHIHLLKYQPHGK